MKKAAALGILWITGMVLLNMDGLAGEALQDSVVIETVCMGERYEAYYEKLMELQTQYGIGTIIPGEYESQITGLCFAKLVDFDNDGAEELMLAYLSGMNEYGFPEYVLEVWEYDQQEMKQLLDGDCVFNQEIYSSIRLSSYEDQFFVVQGIVGEEEYTKWWELQEDVIYIVGSALFGYAGDDFIPVYTVCHGYDEETNELYFVNGEKTTKEGAEDYTRERWQSDSKVFPLTCGPDASELEKTLGELEQTMEILSGWEKLS